MTGALAPNLTADQVKNLILWKWRYLLETEGFTRVEANRLIFWRWMARTGKLGE